MNSPAADAVLSLLHAATQDYTRRGPGGYVLLAQLQHDAAPWGSPDLVFTGICDLLTLGAIEPGTAHGKPAYRLRRRWYAPGGVVRRRFDPAPSGNHYARERRW